MVTQGGSESVLVPQTIRRARGWRLYDQQGTRYLDFSQARGSAFLGHTPKNVVRVMKQELDRGLLSPLPGKWQPRLERVLARLAAVAGVANLTLDESSHVWWPLSGFQTPHGWVDSLPREAEDARGVPASAPTGMRGGSPAGAPVCVVAPGIPLTSTPESPVLLAGAVTGLYALDAYLRSPAANERLALAQRLALPPGYERRGVLIIAEKPPAVSEYEKIRGRAWERGIVLPQDPQDPVVVPGELTAGEIQRWEELCEHWI